jgi:hypothetical protein
MKRMVFYAALVGAVLAVTSTAHATVGCTVVSDEEGAVSVNLYAAPEETSEIVREVPTGDIVDYPDEDLAPAQAEGWAWVGHDATQETIWQIGDFGWMRIENISECG